MDKSRSYSKSEIEDTVKVDTKKYSISPSSSDDKNMKEQQPKLITIKTNKLTRDNQSLSSVYVIGESIMTVSPDGYRIPRKRGKRNFQKFQSQGIK